MSSLSHAAVFKDLGLKLLSPAPLEFVKAARNGIPKKTIDKLAKKLNVPISDFARYLHISGRTLQRYEPGKILSTNISDHVLQITRVYTRCLEIFEDKKNTASWLKQPSIAFGNTPPIELLDTSAEIEMVLDELTRLEYGVAS